MAVRLGDPKRLEALKATAMIGDGLVFPGLDRLTRFAARLLRMPIALVTLVEADRQWFASSVGLPEPWASRRHTPLTHSFCQHVVETGEPLIITDARDDLLLRNNLAIVDLGVVAYGGFPLRDPHGEILGTFCVIDSSPRQWRDEELEVVRELAEVATAEVAAVLTTRYLETTTAQVRAILDTAQDAFAAVTSAGTVAKWNRAAEAMFGWTAAEAHGRRLEELIFPERSREQQRLVLAVTVRGEASSSGPIRLNVVRRDGRELPVEASLSVMGDGDYPAYHVFFRDISGWLAAEQEAERQRAFLNGVLNSLDVGVAACDADGHLVLFNQSALEIPRADLDDVGINNWAGRFDLRHPDGRLMGWDEVPLARALYGERVRDVEVMIKVGRLRRLYLVHGEAIRDADGRILGAVVSMHEITERRRAEVFRGCELAVAQALAGASTAVEAGQQAIRAVGTCLGWHCAELWLLDSNGEELRVVSRWCVDGIPEYTSCPSRLAKGSGLAGRAWLTGAPVIVPDMRKESGLADLAAKHNLAMALAVPVCSGDHTLGVLTIFTDDSPHPLPALVDLLSDVAARVGQFLERRNAEEIAMRLDRAKDDFVALVGHELRTPLTSIGSVIDLILEEPDTVSAETRDLLEMVRRNGATLRTIVDDLLDLAGLESGHIKMRVDPADLSLVTIQAVDAIRSQAAERKLALTSEVTDQVMVRGDPGRLRRALDNLLANAVKFTPPGGEVYVRLRGHGPTCELTVADTGIGIPEHERPLLFERFYRSSAARQRGIPGTGLGLAVARTILERHGGSIRASDNNPGTRFTITLPTTTAPTAPPEHRASSKMANGSRRRTPG